MLFETLNFIIGEVEAYFLRLDRDAYNPILGNIALQDGQGGGNAQDVDDKLVLSLINIEEEKTLKNEPNYRRVGTEIITQNPPLHLNLYLLFSANILDYGEALRALSLVLQFFQHKNTFYGTNYQALRDAGVERLNFEIFDLSFEQTNNLWGVMGGKLVPNVLYKVRMLSLQAAPEQEGGTISEIFVSDQSIIR